MLVDREDEIVFVNERLAKWLGIVKDSLTLENIATGFKEVDDLIKLLKTARQSKQEIKLEPKSWGAKFVSLRLVPIVRGEEVEEMVIFIRDKTNDVVMQRARDEFFSIASHELRTPLTAIMGNTSLIEQYFPDILKNKELADMVGDINESAKRLIGIVNDFLNVSRLELNKIEFKLEPLDLIKEVGAVVDELMVGKTLGTNKLVWEAGQGETKVVADRDRLKEVLINLVGNANKFTHEGTITVKVEKADGRAQVKVRDTGSGIPKDKQSLLFRKFQQAGNSLYTRDTTKGTGLGLYISRLLMNGMKGEVVLGWSEEGKGSEFVVSLPIV